MMIRFFLAISLLPFCFFENMPGSMVAGTYSGIDTSSAKAWCRYNTLVLNADSTFRFSSASIMTEGKWTFKPGKIILNSSKITLTGIPDRLLYDDYDKSHNDIRVKVTGKNGKPVVCEELKCVAGNKSYTRFTYKDGCAYFPVEKFDTVYHVSISDYYKEQWKKAGFCSDSQCENYILWKFTQGSYELVYNVNNDYQHGAEFHNLEFQVKENALIPLVNSQDKFIQKDLPEIPFVRLVKKN